MGDVPIKGKESSCNVVALFKQPLFNDVQAEVIVSLSKLGLINDCKTVGVVTSLKPPQSKNHLPLQ